MKRRYAFNGNLFIIYCTQSLYMHFSLSLSVFCACAVTNNDDDIAYYTETEKLNIYCSSNLQKTHSGL